MPTIKKSNNGIEYLHRILKQKPKTITKACFWKIPHNTLGKIDIRLKIGRHKLIYVEEIERNVELLESETPKSEITLDMEEFLELIDFIQENYEPFKLGVKRYIPINEDIDGESIEFIKQFFNNPDRQKVVEYIQKNQLLTDNQITTLDYLKRIKAVKNFEIMLKYDLKEKEWQTWFTNNSWVLGTDFVKILDERDIDTQHIADYLVEAYDGFLDIIELKRSNGGLRFWSDNTDHGNYYISTELIKAITQSLTYIHQVEKQASTLEFFERVGDIKTIKPRCTLLYGRSNDWIKEQKEAYRILNSSYHNLNILTYDHVLSRAKRILGLSE